MIPCIFHLHRRLALLYLSDIECQNYHQNFKFDPLRPDNVLAKDLESTVSEFVYRDPPSVRMSIQTPGSVDLVKDLEAVEGLLGLKAIPSPEQSNSILNATQENIAGCSGNRDQVKSKVNNVLGVVKKRR